MLRQLCHARGFHRRLWDRDVQEFRELLASISKSLRLRDQVADLEQGSIYVHRKHDFELRASPRMFVWLADNINVFN